MTWAVEWDERARRELRKLDHAAQKKILQYFRDRVAVDADPRRLGRALNGDKSGLWRYRLGDYRIICKIEDVQVVVLVLRVVHRQEIYR